MKNGHQTNQRHVWTRSQNGMFAGICKSIAITLNIRPEIIRVIWIALTVAMGGGGILLYVMLYICIPREDELIEAREPKLMGVCSRLARNFNLDIGLTRLLAVTLIPISFGGTIVGYVLLNFVLEESPLN